MLERIFNLDNPVMVFFGKIADLVILNVIAIIFSIPIFTIGASWTAMHYVTVRMIKKEETYIFKDFLKSFKENFKQATVLWLIALVVIAIFVGDFFIFFSAPDMIPKWVMGGVVIAAYLAFSTILYVFPLLSRYSNTNKKMVLNAFLLSIANVPQTVSFIVLCAVPIVVTIFAIPWFPMVIMIGFSGMAYIGSFWWVRIFKKMEPEVVVTENEENDDIENDESVEE